MQNHKQHARGILTLALTAALLPAAAGAQGNLPLPPAAEQAAKVIDRNSLEGPIRYLSDDLLEGRGPGSRGDELTRLYLATTMELMGLQPAGPNGSWQQPFEIVGITSAPPKTWEFKAGGKTVPLAHWTEFIASSGVQKDRSVLDNAELVFVGYGIEAPEYGWNDFKGMDLKGKVLLMLNSDPQNDEKLFAGKTRLYYGRWTYKYESAARQGAAGAIIIHTTPSAGYPWQVVQTSWTGEQFELPAGNEPRIQVSGWTTEDATKKLLAAAGHDLAKLVEQAQSKDFKPVPLGITTSLTMSNTLTRKQTGNVLGILPGSDPELKDEVVVYSAHHD
ncbi:MAG TPA: M28 family metallopeptidase, partial [Thermoanaerobaculia bacterium]|nr:M28 family metallopeptidase [Thermoanaerobaculia bacterium]